jgi:hypothetical protein
MVSGVSPCANVAGREGGDSVASTGKENNSMALSLSKTMSWHQPNDNETARTNLSSSII